METANTKKTPCFMDRNGVRGTSPTGACKRHGVRLWNSPVGGFAPTHMAGVGGRHEGWQQDELPHAAALVRGDGAVHSGHEHAGAAQSPEAPELKLDS